MNSKQKALIAIIIIGIIGIAAGAMVFLSQQQTTKLRIVATFYPLAFICQEIGGEYVQVTQLVPDNTEIHSWEPSASSIVAAEKADIIVYNGAGADHWVEDEIIPALSSAQIRIIIQTTENLDLIPGTQEEHHEETTEEEHHEHGAYDPHTWISPHMIKQQAEKVYNALIQKDPEHQRYYQTQWINLKAELEDLDNQYITQLATAIKDEIFVSHSAFGYLAQRYGFEQVGVIGLTADEQPSAATIANIVTEMEQHQTYVIYVDPVYSTEYANTLKNELQAQTGQTVTIKELYLILGQTDGKNMIEQMQSNLSNLKLGLEAT
ncbi:MAG: zinc ABC transporter solute-binding protein [Crenarchaeota archaeon]|nr:zinc ABC transporter solute-binding protein [Thermoproteota archaeon]